MSDNEKSIGEYTRNVKQACAELEALINDLRRYADGAEVFHFDLSNTPGAELPRAMAQAQVALVQVRESLAHASARMTETRAHLAMATAAADRLPARKR